MLELILRFAPRNPLHHKLRSVLTLPGVIVATLAFSLLGTIVSAWYAGAKAASDKRRVTRNSISRHSMRTYPRFC